MYNKGGTFMNVNEIFAQTAISAFEKLCKTAIAKNRKMFFKSIIKDLLTLPISIVILSIMLINYPKKMIMMDIILIKWIISRMVCLPLIITDLAKYVVINSSFLNDIHKLMVKEPIKIMLWKNEIIEYDENKYEKWLNETIR
jgi:hypothetical protein